MSPRARTIKRVCSSPSEFLHRPAFHRSSSFQDGSRIVFGDRAVGQGAALRDYHRAYRRGTSTAWNYLAGQTVQHVNQKAYEGTLIAHMDGGTPNIIPRDRPHGMHGISAIWFTSSRKPAAFRLPARRKIRLISRVLGDYKKNMFALLGRSGFEERRKYL